MLNDALQSNTYTSALPRMGRVDASQVVSQA